jgi:hypothetical protein
MNRRTICMLIGMALLSFALLPSGALSQQRSLKDELVGTWTVVSAEQTLPNGTKLQPFGANPKGVLTFDANDTFLSRVRTCRKSRPIVRLNLTPDEAKAIAEGTFAQVSTYASTRQRRPSSPTSTQARSQT